MKPVLLYSDIFFFLFAASCGFFFVWGLRKRNYREGLQRIARNRWALVSLCIIIVYMGIAFLDSFHYSLPLGGKKTGASADNRETVRYGPTRSLFDTLFSRVYPGVQDRDGKIMENIEKTYSSPFSKKSFDRVQNPETGRWEFEKLKKPGAHFWGTDKAGGDVLYKLLKGIRTALIVGLITTMIVIPFAIFFGVTAGYFGGRTDDVIQFIYISLGSIPSILLISAMMMIVNAKLSVSSGTDVFYKDDKIVIFLCVILGLVGWSALCRLLRAETIKLKELDYVKAARGLGVSDLFIMIKYIIPNLIHVVLISSILRFSGLVMVEAILAYIKIGVPTTVRSWGRIVDGARSQLGRDPIIWWPVLGAFILMFLLVFSINIFGDAVRDALDPRLRE